MFFLNYTGAILFYPLFFFNHFLEARIKYCVNCKYYTKYSRISTPLNYVEKNKKYEYANYFGKCSKFQVVNVDTMEMNYKYATLARVNPVDCGLEAKYYTPIKKD